MQSPYAAATLRTRLSLRCWFEWVDSDSNPSDGLSRVGLLCEFIAPRDGLPRSMICQLSSLTQLLC